MSATNSHDLSDLTRHMHRHLAWADVVLDGRLGPPHAVTAALPETLPVPGLPSTSSSSQETVTPGRFESVATAMSSVVSPVPGDTGEVLRLAGYTLTAGGTKGCVIVVLTYPDGFRLALVTGYYKNYDQPAETVWADYLEHPEDGLGHVFAPAQADPEVRRPGTQGRPLAVWRSAANLREIDPIEWWGGAIPDETPLVRFSGSESPMRLFVRHASRGFTSAATAQEFDLSFTVEQAWVVDALDAGFDLNKPEESDFVQVAASGRWPLMHLDESPPDPYWGAWRALRRLFLSPWSRQALAELHSAVVQERMLEVPGMSWTQASGVQAWLDAVETPQMASLCITAGLSVKEARSLAEAGELTAEGLETLTALRQTR